MSRSSQPRKRDASEAASGTHQNLARASLVLQVLAFSDVDGLRLTDIIAETGLTKTVTHRLLTGLVIHGLASHDRVSGRYFLGDRVFVWAQRVGKRFQLAERVIPYLQELAAEFEDTAYFLQRRGDDAVCLGRAEGSFPIKTLTLKVGDRRPLGIGSASLAIAAFFDDAEIKRLLEEHAADRVVFGQGDEEILLGIKTAREHGYTVHDGGLIKGMTGIGVPIRSTGGTPIAALSIVAISSRLLGSRRLQVAGRLREIADRIETDLRPFIDSDADAPFWRAC